MQRNQGRNPIRNGDFQKGRSGEWVEYSEQWSNVIYLDPYNSSNWVADFGLANNEHAYIRQNNVPIQDNYYLNFDLLIMAGESYCGAEFDSLKVYINGKIVKTYDICKNSVNWFSESLYIRNLVGEKFTIDFLFQSDASLISRVLVDNVFLSPYWREVQTTRPVFDSTEEALPDQKFSE